MELNCKSFDFHDLHWSAMSSSKRSSHCKPRCQSSWNNIFALIVNGVISPIGSNTFKAMLNRLLFVSGSLVVSTLAGTLKRRQSVDVFPDIPSVFRGSLALKSMALDSACSFAEMWLRTSFELLAHLVRLNPPRSIILSKDCCNSTVAPTSSAPARQPSKYMFDGTSLDASGNSSRHFVAWLWTVQWTGMDYNSHQMPISATCRFSVDRHSLNPFIYIVERRRLFRQLWSGGTSQHQPQVRPQVFGIEVGLIQDQVEAGWPWKNTVFERHSCSS